MTTNEDRVRDNMQTAINNTAMYIAELLDSKDRRIADLEHQLDAVTAALVKERGLPV